MEDIKLSEHFGLNEFCATSHKEYAAANYDLGISNLSKLTFLAQDLEIIRAVFKAPLLISCGVRCEGLNALVGGAASSQHLKAEAVDFSILNVGALSVFEWIVKTSGLKYGQVIYETKGGAIWIHYSLGEPFRVKEKCLMALIFRDGKYSPYSG